MRVIWWATSNHCAARGGCCGPAGEVSAYLTACDQAADRVQTHHPTAVLRFDTAERAVLRAALASP